jgi:hypothetical protein
MAKKYKVISEDLVKSLVEFLDEVQFDAAGNATNEDMQKVNFCNWAINELLNSYDAYLKYKSKDKKDDNKPKPQSKSRDTYVEETFMDWNLPDMSDEDYEKLVDQFDNFLRAWEKEYYKNNPKKKPETDREYKEDFKPDVEDVIQYMSLDEIAEYLKDDPELTDNERFELYYDERERQKRLKEEGKGLSYEELFKGTGITPPKSSKG